MKTLHSYTKSFLFHCQYERNLSEKTIKAYRIDLRQFLEFMEKNRCEDELDTVSRDSIRQYLEYLSKWKPKTVKRKVACLKALFNHLEFEDVIAVNPFRKMRIRIKEPKVLPVVMSQDEVEKILKQAYTKRSTISEKNGYEYKSASRDIAVLEMLFATGIRISELCRLTPTNINVETGLLKVTGKGDKDRVIQVFAVEARLAIKTYASLFKGEIERNGSFFVNRIGQRLSPQSVRYMVRNYKELARIDKHITPHTFRHTFATLLLEADVDIKYIQHLLGHSSITTTQIYTHVNTNKQREILQTKHPRANFQMT